MTHTTLLIEPTLKFSLSQSELIIATKVISTDVNVLPETEVQNYISVLFAEVTLDTNAATQHVKKFYNATSCSNVTQLQANT